MNCRTATNKRGFSLIELVIVVVIIGIIGAIAIPRLSRGAEGAADSKVVGDLAVLRSAIDLYSAEHGGKFPSEDPATFINQLTQYTDIHGNVSATKTGEFIYGPYLRRMPRLSVGSNQGESAILGAASGTLGASGAGWFYSQASGEIRPNLPDGEQDAIGTNYNEY